MGSLLLKRAQLTEALVATEEAERSLELARRRLAALMNETDPGSFLLQGDLRAEEPPPARELALNELARRTPSYRSAEADIKAAEQGFLIARSERFPTISASAALSLSGENDIRKEGWEAGLSISLPLFTGGQLSQDILAAGLRREQTRLTAERTMLDLMNTLHAAFNTWCDRHAAIRVQAAQLEAAEMRAAVARAQYEQGLISFQEWDTIENQLITSQRNWLSSLRAADQAQAAWQNALGGSALQQEPGL
jgi:outer membrane protein TolC